MKDESRGQIVKKFACLRAKTYSYLTDNNDKIKKAQKKCVIKRRFNFQDYKNYLQAIQIENKINHLEKK